MGGWVGAGQVEALGPVGPTELHSPLPGAVEAEVGCAPTCSPTSGVGRALLCLSLGLSLSVSLSFRVSLSVTF